MSVSNVSYGNKYRIVGQKKKDYIVKTTTWDVAAAAPRHKAGVKRISNYNQQKSSTRQKIGYDALPGTFVRRAALKRSLTASKTLFLD